MSPKTVSTKTATTAASAATKHGKCVLNKDGKCLNKPKGAVASLSKSKDPNGYHSANVFQLCKVYQKNASVLKSIAKFKKPSDVEDKTTMEYLIFLAEQKLKSSKSEKSEQTEVLKDEVTFLKKLDKYMDKHELSRDDVGKLSTCVNKQLILHSVEWGDAHPALVKISTLAANKQAANQTDLIVAKPAKPVKSGTFFQKVWQVNNTDVLDKLKIKIDQDTDVSIHGFIITKNKK